jgi:hypothetical protein
MAGPEIVCAKAGMDATVKIINAQKRLMPPFLAEL